MSGDALEGLGEEPLCEVVGLDAEAGVVAQEGEQLRVQRARGRHRVDPLRHHPQAGVAGAEEVARLARRLLQGARVLDACVGEARLQVSQLAEKGSVVVQLLLERGPATLLARARILPVRAPAPVARVQQQLSGRQNLVLEHDAFPGCARLLLSDLTPQPLYPQRRGRAAGEKLLPKLLQPQHFLG
eukprot:CAMPEP_0180174788 /NCGR_PEP_ID=MMETSP0986-20121125/36358_1 /TAXON_ID=697907 /ORGANISM="non described non described, Strain CCMP2293" /LENGTH=185 /DNA_ID=CAMNT_0022127191 /DNA_START=191 /DNA_END=749 /DNA_ORIENTATION=+